MGRATINSEVGRAKYRVSLDFGQDTLNDKIAALQARVSDLEGEQVTLESNLAQAQADELTARSELNAAIASYRASIEAGGGSAEKQAVQDATRLSITAQILLQQANTALSGNKAERATAQAKIDYLSTFSLTETRDVWCADYTLDASGQVATVEVPGEADAVVIAPGADPAVDADGLATARPAQESHQLYFNYAILPGWQKFSPTYRFGQITAIDRQNNTCDITLEAAASSAQDLDINQSATLSAVPVEYMTCNAAAFEVWDYVLIKFEGGEWGSPKVVGFKEEPRPCAPARMFYPFEVIGPPATGTVVSGYPYSPNSEGIGAAWGADSVTESRVGGGQFGYRINTTTSTGSFGPYPLVPAPELGIEAPEPPLVFFQVTGLSLNLRLRFDVAWKVERVDQLEWKRQFPSEAYTETTHGTDIVLESNVSENEILFVSDFGKRFQYIPTSSYSFTEILPGSGNNVTYIGEYYVTGSQTVETYDMFSDGFNLNPGTSPDIAGAAAWLSSFFNIPQTITIVVNDAPVQFVLEGVGKHPEYYEGKGNTLLGGISVPPLSPPSGWSSNVFTSAYTMDFDNQDVAGAYYRRADLPAE